MCVHTVSPVPGHGRQRARRSRMESTGPVTVLRLTRLLLLLSLSTASRNHGQFLLTLLPLCSGNTRNTGLKRVIHTHTTRVHAGCIRVSMCPSCRLALVHGDARCVQCPGVPSYPPCKCTNLCGKEACCKLLLLPRFKQTNKPHQHHQILISLTDSFLHAPDIRLSQITTHPLHRVLYSHV